MTVSAPDTPLASLPAFGTATLPAQIHEYLEEAIIQGDIAPGSRLRADELAAHYGVSRIPVREALRSLQEAGWVEIRPRSGVYVREHSEVELRELFEARAVIEAELASLAARRRDDSDLTLFGQAIERARSAASAGDALELGRASVAFNAAIRSAAGNSVLAAVSLSLEKRARFYFSMIADRFGSDWVHVEEQLAAHIANQSSAAAAECQREHVLATGAAVQRLLEERA
ncbi:GntR family transcriptional regulator [Ruicaihuangia caeni]|uniref:GntR family transcriptional regulator n=1 Tax=Ruicaihuangia caeni TaxID=3042517 RepID=UPI00338EEBEB